MDVVALKSLLELYLIMNWDLDMCRHVFAII